MASPIATTSPSFRIRESVRRTVSVTATPEKSAADHGGGTRRMRARMRSRVVTRVGTGQTDGEVDESDAVRRSRKVSNRVGDSTAGRDRPLVR